MQTTLNPGLLILHGNRLERLAEAVFAWLARNPLDALEEESFLVQSNGMAEWLKMEIAAAQGVCAATRVELPARFLWRAYRAVLGRSAVPPRSALDKLPMTWRLMGLLPTLAERAGFEPVAGFLGRGDPSRRLQLAQRLADLFDQYQVYRPDWLQDWAAGRNILRAEAHAARFLPRSSGSLNCGVRRWPA
ncbi:MAG: exodeoxyribonuclease V subunit gamma [Burkholderiaceae bacterium]